jgi:hypothetical protein
MTALARTIRRAAHRRAFTFVEILATMAFLGIVLPPAMNGLSLCMATAQSAKHQAQATSLCHGKVMELVALGQWQHDNQSGDFGTDWPEYRWTAQVTDFDGSTLKNMEVTVSWQSRGQDHTVTLSTLVYTGGQP